MSGRIDWISYVILAVSIIAVMTDLLRGKIYNFLTVPVALAGLFYSFYFFGLSGLGQAALAMMVALALYGWMFALGVIGGGDVKFLMALGAWGGVRYTIEVGLLAILVGGVFALGVLIAKSRFQGFLSRLYLSLITLMTPNTEFQLPELDRKLTMPFGIPISLAAVCVIFLDPMGRWSDWI